MVRRLLLALPLAIALASAVAAPEPSVQRSVQEDDNVRIDELRVRGVTQRIIVRPKAGGQGAALPEYEILPAEPGRDSAQDRRAAGQRVWRLFSF